MLINVRYLTNGAMLDMRLYLSFRKIENEIYGAQYRQLLDTQY